MGIGWISASGNEHLVLDGRGRSDGSEILWSHTSACPDPMSMEIRLPSGELFDPGERWDGEAGRQKEAIIEAQWITTDPVYHAAPIEWVGEPGRDCMGDLVTSELAPGAAIEAQLAWVAASGSDAELIGTIVGEVNAVTGEVVDVRPEHPPQ